MFELLIRMVDEQGQLVPPMAFIPAAERYNLMPAVDRWVIRTALPMIARARAAEGGDAAYIINLSGASLGDERLLDFIREEIDLCDVASDAICFEVTETAAIGNMDEARRFVATLTDIGCCFALDDFGAGFGSFYYLKYLSLDYLKIDGEFIRNLPASTTDQLILRSIVQMANGLGKKTIAEFVGNQESLQLLREHGVQYAQGYHIGRPRPLTELRAPVRTNAGATQLSPQDWSPNPGESANQPEGTSADHRRFG